MRFLCVSDIHGHARSLTEVLREADTYGWDQLVACGDHLFPGPEPLETWKLLVQHRALCLQGIGDRALARVNPAKLAATDPEQQARLERLREMHSELGELIVMRLGKLPTVARLPLENGNEMVVVHGSPADPTEAFTPDMSDDELSALLGDDPADIVVCGGSHAHHLRGQRRRGARRRLGSRRDRRVHATGHGHQGARRATAGSLSTAKSRVDA
jgi:predicted phosphodiesterase